MANRQHSHRHGLGHRRGGRSAGLRGSSWWSRLLEQLRRGPRRTDRGILVALPAELRSGALAESYLMAHGGGDHRRAGAAAVAASRQAVALRNWGIADIWSHRALWHFEQAGMLLHAARTARMIGDLRVAAGDSTGSRAYYAEAISEARDLGAEREEGLAALGLGRAELELGNVTAARRLAQFAIDVLQRYGAPDADLAAARELRGQERLVGERATT